MTTSQIWISIRLSFANAVLLVTLALGGVIALIVLLVGMPAGGFYHTVSELESMVVEFGLLIGLVWIVMAAAELNRKGGG